MTKKSYKESNSGNKVYIRHRVELQLKQGCFECICNKLN